MARGLVIIDEDRCKGCGLCAAVCPQDVLELAEGRFPSKHIDYQVFPAEYSNRDNFGPFEVPKGEYFVLGDNRNQSQDSHYQWTVPTEQLVGKAWISYWPPDNISIIEHFTLANLK